MGCLVNAPDHHHPDGTDTPRQSAKPLLRRRLGYPTTGFRIQLPGVADKAPQPLEPSPPTGGRAPRTPQDPVIQTVS